MYRFLLSLLVCCNLFGQAPQINTGGVTGAGLSTPPVTSVAPNGIVSIFGTNFAPAGTIRDASAADIQDGQLPTVLNGVCVQFGTTRAALINLRDSQINAIVPGVGSGSAGVQVIANCGTASPVSSNTVQVPVQATAPEFFYFNHNAAGMNQIAGADATTGIPAGSVGLIAGASLAPASPGDIVTLYATGLGATQPAIVPGTLAPSAGQITATITMTIGGEAIPAANIQYAGVSPTFSGLYQINVLLPADLSDGLLPVALTVGGVGAPASTLAVHSSPCTTPSIFSFSAVPNQFSAPAPATVSWSTDADRVDITQVGTALQPGSSATLQVASSTTLTLTAQSVCGVATQTLLIAVGAPSIKSTRPLTGNGSGASGAPGDVVSLTFGNLADPSTVSEVDFRAASGASIAAIPLGVAADGSIQVRVPLLADMNQSSGYDTGPFFVSAVAGMLPSAEVPFTVLSIPAVASPATAFQQLLTNVFGQTESAIAMGEQLSGPADEFTAISAQLAIEKAELQQIASSLAASGTATFPEEDANSTNPTPDSATVTASDLALYMAYNVSSHAMPPQTSPAVRLVSRAQSVQPFQGLDSSCIRFQVPALAPCYVIEAIDADINGVADLLDNEVIKSAGKLKVFSGAAKLAGKINLYATYAKIACWLQPIHVTKFTLSPNNITSIGKPSTPVGAIANLSGLMAPNPMAVLMYLENQLENAANKRLDRRFRNYGPTVQQDAKQIADELYGAITDFINNKLHLTPGPIATGTAKVGACDLQDLYAYQEDKQGYSKFVGKDTGIQQGMPDYYYYGRRKGVADIYLVPYATNFLFSPAAFTTGRCNMYPDGSVRCEAPLYVNAPKRLQVTTFHSCAYLDQDSQGGFDTCRNNTVLADGADVTNGVAFLQPYFDNAYSLLNVRQTTDASWQIAILGAADEMVPSDPTTWYNANSSLSVSIDNPPNTDDTQRVVINLSAMGQCSGSVTVNPGNGPLMTIPLSSGTTRTLNLAGASSVSFTAGTAELGTASCAVIASVQLPDN